MAIGDKNGVVMESDRAVPGGIATLGADGKLLDAQIPGLDKLGAAPALESTAYPGCYYRMVDGEVEWINPPMIPGEEYRTTERYNGKPLYVKRVQCATPAASTTTRIPIGEENIHHCFVDMPRSMWATGSAGTNNITMQNVLDAVYIDSSEVVVEAGSSAPAVGYLHFVVRYTKTTD